MTDFLYKYYKSLIKIYQIFSMQSCIIYAYEDDYNDNENYKNFSIEK